MTHYKIYIIEAGRVHHTWYYDCLDDAIHQYNGILKIYEDVPGVTAIMLPVDTSQLTSPLYSLLNSIVSHA